MFQLDIQQTGRGGDISVRTAAGEHRFPWEFGGGDCIAMVFVPGSAEWPRLPALADHDRHTFLTELAERIRAQQCAGARIEIGEQFIEFQR